MTEEQLSVYKDWQEARLNKDFASADIARASIKGRRQKERSAVSTDSLKMQTIIWMRETTTARKNSMIM